MQRADQASTSLAATEDARLSHSSSSSNNNSASCGVWSSTATIVPRLLQPEPRAGCSVGRVFRLSPPARRWREAAVDRQEHRSAVFSRARRRHWPSPPSARRIQGRATPDNLTFDPRRQPSEPAPKAPAVISPHALFHSRSAAHRPRLHPVAVSTPSPRLPTPTTYLLPYPASVRTYCSHPSFSHTHRNTGHPLLAPASPRLAVTCARSSNKPTLLRQAPPWPSQPPPPPSLHPSPKLLQPRNEPSRRLSLSRRRPTMLSLRSSRHPTPSSIPILSSHPLLTSCLPMALRSAAVRICRLWFTSNPQRSRNCIRRLPQKEKRGRVSAKAYISG